MDSSLALLLELDKLKHVFRKSYTTDPARQENSAEHSWHLAVAFIALKEHLPESLNVNHAMQMALLHDVCEIGAGDVCAYHADANQQSANELTYLSTLRNNFSEFGNTALASWKEYEAQITLESRWVKVIDKLLPFILNLANEGRTWQEQKISADNVRQHNAFIQHISPDIYAWMMNQCDEAERKGWF